MNQVDHAGRVDSSFFEVFRAIGTLSKTTPSALPTPPPPCEIQLIGASSERKQRYFSDLAQSPLTTRDAPAAIRAHAQAQTSVSAAKHSNVVNLIEVMRWRKVHF